MKNILKVLKTSFAYATDVVGFVKENPALKVRLPRYDVQEKDPAHIFTPKGKIIEQVYYVSEENKEDLLLDLISDKEKPQLLYLQKPKQE